MTNAGEQSPAQFMALQPSGSSRSSCRRSANSDGSCGNQLASTRPTSIRSQMLTRSFVRFDSSCIRTRGSRFKTCRPSSNWLIEIEGAMNVSSDRTRSPVNNNCTALRRFPSQPSRNGVPDSLGSWTNPAVERDAFALSKSVRFSRISVRNVLRTAEGSVRAIQAEMALSPITAY